MPLDQAHNQIQYTVTRDRVQPSNLTGMWNEFETFFYKEKTFSTTKSIYVSDFFLNTFSMMFHFCVWKQNQGKDIRDHGLVCVFNPLTVRIGFNIRDSLDNFNTWYKTYLSKYLSDEEKTTNLPILQMGPLNGFVERSFVSIFKQKHNAATSQQLIIERWEWITSNLQSRVTFKDNLMFFHEREDYVLYKMKFYEELNEGLDK